MTTFLAVTSAATTIVSDSAIQGELALSDTATIWITTLYLLGLNTTVPAATWFANHFGYKRMYTYGVLIFTFGSALVGFSNDFIVLASARVIEGIGAGLIFPMGLGLIVQTLPKEKIGLALNLYIGGAFGGGLGIGIPIIGLFCAIPHLEGIFWIMIPLAFSQLSLAGLRDEKWPK